MPGLEVGIPRDRTEEGEGRRGWRTGPPWGWGGPCTEARLPTEAHHILILLFSGPANGVSRVGEACSGAHLQEGSSGLSQSWAHPSPPFPQGQKAAG